MNLSVLSLSYLSFFIAVFLCNDGRKKEFQPFGRIISIEVSGSEAGNVSEPRLIKQSRQNARTRVRIDQCLSAVRLV
jgi:hypothetical protein